MIIFPREQAIIQNLNSYYVDIDRLFEHYQGELGSGGVFFTSPSAEALILFDEEVLFNGIYRDRNGQITGQSAIETLLDAVASGSFNISVYEIPLDMLFFWASLPTAKIKLGNLSSEFTDLSGLIQKMRDERLVGSIEVKIGDGRERGAIYFVNGEIIGSSYYKGRSKPIINQANLDILVEKTPTKGTVFEVREITAAQEDTSRKISPLLRMQARKTKTATPTLTQAECLDMVEQLLIIFENTIKRNRRVNVDFYTVLKRKFMQKADHYDYLDPFADEFIYAGGKLTFTGEATNEELIKGILECVLELGKELGSEKYLAANMNPWKVTHSKILEAMGIEL